MDRCHFRGLLILGFLLIFSGSTGCGTAKSAARKVADLSSKAVSSVAKEILPEKSGLKKRVMVLSFIDYSGLGPGIGEQVAANFSELLGKSNDLLVFRPENNEEWAVRNKSPRFGIINDPELVRKAFELNMNALITGVFDVNGTGIKKTGIWPFRKSWSGYEVLTVINVVDPMTDTLLLSKKESKELLVRLDTERSGHKGLIDMVFGKILPRVLQNEASFVCKKLKESPWTGRILAMEDGMIKINAGKDVGAHVGCRFEVFDRGETIPSQSGMVFVLLGKKAGEIEVTSTMDEYSLAKPITKGTFSEGQTIRYIMD